MLAPDIAYSFRLPKDVSGPTLEVLSRIATEAGTATTVTFEFSNLAKDRILILNNVSARGTPGATQACTNLVIRAVTAAGLFFDVARNTFVVAADVVQTLNWQGSVFIPGGGTPSTTVQVNADFDAGVASNTVRVSIHGTIIPRANVAQF